MTAAVLREDVRRGASDTTTPQAVIAEALSFAVGDPGTGRGQRTRPAEPVERVSIALQLRL